MSSPYTLRILEIDGGGTRGYIPSVWLELFCNQAGIAQNELWKYFDVITGASIGGIIALGLGKGLSPVELQNFFTADAPWIFTTDSAFPSVMPSTLSKINTMVNGPLSNPTFYPSTTDGIGTRRLKSKLESVFGSDTLQNALTNVLIPSFEKSPTDPNFGRVTNSPVYFSNISSNSVPLLIGQNTLAVDVAMATSAAPIYFPAYSIADKTYIDGGTTINNMTSFATTIGRVIKPSANRYCVLSLGTGLGDVGFDTTSSSFKARLTTELEEFRFDPSLYARKYKLSTQELNSYKQLDGLGLFENARLLMFLLGAMIAGPQENIAQQLQIQANSVTGLDSRLQNYFYYRMQYFLQPALNTELDNTVPEILAYYKSSVTDYYHNDQNDITNFIGHFLA